MFESEIEGVQEDVVRDAIDVDEIKKLGGRYHQPEISLHALTGSHNPRTMRAMGKIGGHWITILIDTGSTHNSLDPAIFSKVKLPINTTKRVSVKVTNEEVIPSEGKLITPKLLCGVVV